MGRAKRIAAFFWKTLLGVIFCQSLILSVLVVGWTYRVMQRAAVKRWVAECLPNASLVDAARDVPVLSHLRTWPHWFRASAEEPRRMRRWFGGLGANAALGFSGLATTWSLTLVPMLMWNMSWYAGWNNSFNKGYEQAAYGPLLGFSGVLVFMIVMLYVPMAQARQAIAGEWRAFYDFRTVRTVARERPVACLLLAAAFSAFSLPVMLFKTAPLFIEKFAPETSAMNARELLEYLNAFYFRAGLVGLGFYVALRIAAARVYAGGLLQAYAHGRVSVEALSKFERESFRALRVPESGYKHAGPAWVRPVRRGFAAAMAAAALLVWFTFVAQIYVSEFLNYHPVRGWLNQPLVQAPWFRYVPEALRRAASEIEAP